MRYYNSKNVEREYVVVKHQLRGIDTEVLGVRYRQGYGVVAKDSKEYYNLKQIKLCVTAEYPLIFLQTLKCIINATQVKAIWGANIYTAYRKQLQAAKIKLQETNKAPDLEELITYRCEQTTAAGTKCKNTSIDNSCFCKSHIHFDKRIAAKIIEAGDIDKDLRKSLINKWITELE